MQSAKANTGLFQLGVGIAYGHVIAGGKAVRVACDDKAINKTTPRLTQTYAPFQVDLAYASSQSGSSDEQDLGPSSDSHSQHKRYQRKPLEHTSSGSATTFTSKSPNTIPVRRFPCFSFCISCVELPESDGVRLFK